VKRPYCAPSPILRGCLLFLGAVQIAALLVAFERPAQAYIDPGSGFVFLQVAGSMFAGAVYYLRHRLKRIFSSLRKPSRAPSPAGAPVEVVENQP
jgi:hypothetical protein